MNRIPELMQRKGLRDNKRYLQKDMVEATGLTSAAVSRIINNRTLDHVPLSSAIPIAKWLGVHVEELIQEVDDNADIP